MTKECIVLDGNVINIGPWDYQYTVEDGVQVALNPLPDGAITEDKEVSQDEDGGWFVVGTTKPKTPDQLRIEQLETQLAAQNENNAAFMDFVIQTLGV